METDDFAGAFVHATEFRATQSGQPDDVSTGADDRPTPTFFAANLGIGEDVLQLFSMLCRKGLHAVTGLPFAHREDDGQRRSRKELLVGADRRMPHISGLQQSCRERHAIDAKVLRFPAPIPVAAGSSSLVVLIAGTDGKQVGRINDRQSRVANSDSQAFAYRQIARTAPLPL